LLQRGGERGPLAPDGQGGHDLLGQGEGAGGPGQLALHAPAPGERPVGRDDRLALAVVERVLGEVLLYEVDELAVAQRVPAAGGHLVDGRTRGVGPRGG